MKGIILGRFVCLRFSLGVCDGYIFLSEKTTQITGLCRSKRVLKQSIPRLLCTATAMLWLWCCDGLIRGAWLQTRTPKTSGASQPRRVCVEPSDCEPGFADRRTYFVSPCTPGYIASITERLLLASLATVWADGANSLSCDVLEFSYPWLYQQILSSKVSESEIPNFKGECGGRERTQVLFSMAMRSSSLFRHSTFMLRQGPSPSPRPSTDSTIGSSADGVVKIFVICRRRSLEKPTFKVPKFVGGSHRFQRRETSLRPDEGWADFMRYIYRVKVRGCCFSCLLIDRV